MRKLCALALLTTMSALQGMEEREKNNAEGAGNNAPYATLYDIGKVKRAVTDQEYLRSTAYISEVETFYIGADSIELRRIPCIASDDGVLAAVKSAFEKIGLREKSGDRLKYFKNLFEAKNAKRYEESGVDLSDVNWALPLFLHPEVKLRKQDGEVYLKRGDREVVLRRAGRIYYDNGRVSENANWFFGYATPMQFAAMSGDVPAIEWLLSQGASPYKTTGDVPATPFELLINLVRYEQRQIGRTEGYTEDVINARTKAAEKFVNEQWQRMLKRHSPTYINKMKDLVLNRNTATALAVILAFLIYQYFLSQPKV